MKNLSLTVEKTVEQCSLWAFVFSVRFCWQPFVKIGRQWIENLPADMEEKDWILEAKVLGHGEDNHEKVSAVEFHVHNP